ncbi:MAG: heavy metal translocating P-type ATPase [Candidatus Methanomethylophilaceae archaeon]|nr:heavy metal translocating P-type ATPase [Candidatus Methanomethylophilaceae archaeon]MDD3986170.1 heavy metal translocating P-type ATPase [Candidatus Methanomethylophilaceae archaeon]MDD4708876.1 heavy metal translocating P-type ATPase [Candidatus Methanomethylophilaceae archaeon]MDY0251814.1 heavy metal translocating P-type ATPase [Candidatus Methanomethylophilaceae archaeon]
MRRSTAEVLVSGILFASGAALHYTGHGTVSTAILVAAYVISGYVVAISAAKSLRYGMVLDENFLTVIASAGAFMIGAGVEGAAVMMFFRIGELFEEAAVQKTRRSISELVEMQPTSVRVVRDGKEMAVSPEEVAVGEHYIVLPGERIPIDGTVISGYSSLNAKAITGESMPRDVAPGEPALSGCINMTGAITVKADRVYSESAVARILELVEESGAKKAKTEKFITAFARYYTPSVVVAAVTVAAVPTLIFGLPYEVWIYRALVFLVVSCPCALVLSVPLTFFCGVGRASKSGILINGGDVMDRLALTDTVVVDKTGTVTKGSFEFSGIYPCGVTEDCLLEYAAKSEYRSDHPISAAIIDRYGRDIDPGEIGESANLAGKGIRTEVNGHIVHAGNARLMEDLGVEPCVAHGGATSIHVAIDGTYSGHISISDEPKEDSAEAVRELRDLGVKNVVMLTGDNMTSAGLVAKAVGIETFRGDLLPEDKLDILEGYLGMREGKGSLVYVGDGINDAPSIARADVGVAMGGIGSDSAVEAADMVIMNDSLRRLPEAIRISRRTRGIAYQNIVFSLGFKFAALAFATFGLAGMWFAIFADVGVAAIAIINGTRAYGRTL